MAKRVWIGGNWKAAATKAVVHSQVDVMNAAGEFPPNAEVVIFPSALHMGSVVGAIRPDVGVGIQDVHTVKAPGAFTGSHTVAQVLDFGGIGWVLTGHSERRTLWDETDAGMAAKTRVALDGGLGVAACIGETLAERDAGHTLDVVKRQVQAIVDAVPVELWPRLVLAYEPVWAIGTGRVATPAQAQEVHAALREFLASRVGAPAASAMRIVYGGSVTKEHAGTLISQPDIDGFLVGGASLKPDFVDICRSAALKA